MDLKIKYYERLNSKLDEEEASNSYDDTVDVVNDE